MNELEFPDVFEAAARATINERCAPAYLHDIRGSMQALFSALELLGRSAMSGANPGRVEKACDLARRAISHHEKSTMGVLQLLTLQQVAAAPVDLSGLLGEVVHFLRNDAANRGVTVTMSGAIGLYVSAERTKLQTLLVGLVMAAIDETPMGMELELAAERRGDEAVISIASSAGYVAIHETDDFWTDEHTKTGAHAKFRPRELTLMFARQFLSANGGHLEIAADAPPRGAMYLHYPCVEASSSPEPEANRTS